MNVTEYRQAQAKAMPEATLQALIIDLAKRTKHDVYHTHDSRRSEPGFPDLCIAGHGRLLFAELKSEKGKTSPDQDRWLGHIRDSGILAYLWRPSDWLSGAIAQVLAVTL